MNQLEHKRNVSTRGKQAQTALLSTFTAMAQMCTLQDLNSQLNATEFEGRLTRYYLVYGLINY